MITKLIQNLATAIRRSVLHRRAEREFCRQIEFPF